MTPGIRTAALLALACSGLAGACRRPADPDQLKAVDTLITTVEAALLTLNELDPVRYARLDSVFTAEQGRFADRFDDTLDRATADTLGNLFLVLRASNAMGRDHERVVQDLGTTAMRLRALRNDLANGTMPPEEGATALATERVTLGELEIAVHRAIDNYRTVQHAGDDLPRLTDLLSGPSAIASNTSQR